MESVFDSSIEGLQWQWEVWQWEVRKPTTLFYVLHEVFVDIRTIQKGL
jgi:hypothetical protein